MVGDKKLSSKVRQKEALASGGMMVAAQFAWGRATGPPPVFSSCGAVPSIAGGIPLNAGVTASVVRPDGSLRANYCMWHVINRRMREKRMRGTV